ncbi:MAG: carbohydrate-binding protein, partial [Lachnospiraceae bacterium]|nr:carbohydrate-binding protein [Lachnospiraceae bacterium]
AYIKFDSNVVTNIIRNVYELNNWRRKHDKIVTNGFSNTSRSETTAPNCTLEQYVNEQYIWPLKGYETVLYSGLEDEYVYMVGQDVIHEADFEVAANVRLSAGQKLPRRGFLGANDTVWLAPEGDTDFKESDTMTKAAGNEKSMDVPAVPGEYKLYIAYEDGHISDASTFTLYVGENSDIANVYDGQNINVSKLRPLELELDENHVFTLNGKSVTTGYEISTAGIWTLKSGNETITFTTTVTDANKILEDNVTVDSEGDVYFSDVLSDASKTIWLAPSGLSAFADNDPTMSRAAGNSASMKAPKQSGTYILTIVDANGGILSQSDAFVTVR